MALAGAFEVPFALMRLKIRQKKQRISDFLPFNYLLGNNLQ